MEDLGRQRAENDADVAQLRTRGAEDFGEQRSDLETSYGRNLSDLLTNRQQTSEDYGTSIANLARNYQRLGNNQAQKSRQMGVGPGQGGFAAQAARKRAENQTIERNPIDTSYNRANAASALSESRLGEDRTESLSDILRSETRYGQDLDTQATRGYGALDRAG